MYKCCVCGRSISKKHSLRGYSPLCSKHMHQIHKHGHPLDNNPRTVNDLNEFRKLDDGTFEFDLYDVHGNVTGSFIIDADDLHIVRYKKWRSGRGYPVTGSKAAGGIILLSRMLLGVTDPEIKVDHINGNKLDNRKSNLRVCAQGENTYNKSYMALNTSGFIGVSRDKRPERTKKWQVEVRYKNRRFRLGSYLTIEEAVYARYIGTQLLYKEFRNTNNDEAIQKAISSVPGATKNVIRTYCENRIQEKLKEYNLSE